MASLGHDLPPAVADLITKEWMERWAADAARAPRTSSFWAHVGRPDSMLTAAFVRERSALAEALLRAMDEVSAPGAAEFSELLQSELAESAEAIAAAYLEARPRGRLREWSTVLEHLDLMQDMAAAQEHPDAEALGDIYERIGGRR